MKITSMLKPLQSFRCKVVALLVAFTYGFRFSGSGFGTFIWGRGTPSTPRPIAAP